MNRFNEHIDLGKLVDAGEPASGGRVDSYWNRVGIHLNPFSITGEKSLFEDAYLHNSEEALKTFGLRGIEFGNWMNAQDKAEFLYGSMSGLFHLSKIYNVFTSEIGLNGKLSIALGARGRSAAMAHFEPSPTGAINLTKTKGKGSLAHEYAHAFDNALSFHTGGKMQSYVSGGSSVRKTVNPEILNSNNVFEREFETIFKKLYYQKNGDKTAFNLRISKLPRYWNERAEVWARTFEVYTTTRLKEEGLTNHFLAEPDYDKTFYPTSAEVKRVREHIDNIMSLGFQVLRDGPRLSGVLLDMPLVTGYDGFRKTLKKNASLSDTLKNIKRIAIRDQYQVEQLAFSLKGSSVEQTARNIWEYLRANINYKLDNENFEELRTPARTIHDSQIGVDCDDYTILVSAILLVLGIDHEYRVAAYKKPGKFEHIYPVALDSQGGEYIIDAVPQIPRFNFEAGPILTLKTINMELHELSGLGEAPQDSFATDLQQELNQEFSLSGVEDDLEDEILESSFLEGFTEVEDVETADVVLSGSEVMDFANRGILAEINKARTTLLREQKAPSALSSMINLPKELDTITNLMDAWDDEQDRNSVLKDAINMGTDYEGFYKSILFSLDALEEEGHGLSGIDEDMEIFLKRISPSELEDFEDMELEGLGRGKKKGRLKNFFKKVGKTAKKGLKAIVRFNPATITLRASILMVLKTNTFKIASTLIYGYLTEQQANTQGLNLSEWRKIEAARKRAEGFYTKIGGKKEKFRKAIVTGRAAKKTGVQLSGLGEPTTAAAATATTAASGFIAFMKKILKKVNPANLFKGRKNRNQNDSMIPGDQPEFTPNQSSNFPGNRASNSPNFSTRNNVEAGSNFNQDASDQDGNETGFMDKVKGFFSRNKTVVIVSSLGIVILVGVLIWRKKQGMAVAGVKRKPRKKAAPKRKAPAKRKPKQLSGTRAKTLPAPRKRSTTTSNGNRLKKMHAKAKQLQKKHPKTKYSTLLKRAATMI